VFTKEKEIINMELTELTHKELVELFLSVQGKDKKLVRECFIELISRGDVATLKEKRGEKKAKGNTAELLRKIKLNERGM
tara:strand:- start:318 stop:557 length:240 start_codon:yes stop_codon:yes gene_type:complete